MSHKVCIIGLGGCGSKVVERIPTKAYEGLSVVAVNTDVRALESTDVQTKMQLAPSMTNGLGAGGDVEVGRKALESDIVKISALCMDASLLILVVGLGGGTGTGGASLILDAARQAGAMTLCFVTMPFEFEGSQRRAQAERAVPDLSRLSDALIMIRNDRLSEFVGTEGVSESFDKVNEVLGNGVSSIAQLLIKPGFINLDFSDLRKVVRASGGICTFGYGYGDGEDKAEKAVTELLSGPLVSDGEILANARSVLVSIAGGDDLTLKNIGDVMNGLTSVIHAGCNISMGTVVDDAWNGRICVTAVVSDKWIADTEQGTIEDAPAAEDAFVETARKERQKVKDKDSEPSREPRKKKKAEMMQDKLTLKTAGLERFKGAAPSLMNGEDLDIPTFKRRGIRVEK